MDVPASARRRNPRGSGERLRENIITATLRLLDGLADDQALSMRAVTRELGIAATSIYLHFSDRDALVLACLHRCHDDLLETTNQVEAASDDPVAALRARTLALGTWAQQHPGLYRVLHESTLNQRTDTSFKQELAHRTTAAVQRCMDAGLAPDADATTIGLDLRAAVHGAVSMRLSQPGLRWPPLEDQIDRFLTKLVGVPPL